MHPVKTVEDLQHFELTEAGKAMVRWLNETHADVFELDQPDYAKYLFMEALTDTFEQMDKHTLQLELMNHEVGFTQLLICGLVRTKIVTIAPYVPPKAPVMDPLMDYEPRCLDCGAELQLAEEGRYKWVQPLIDGELDDSDSPELDQDEAWWECSVNPTKHHVPVMYFDDDFGWIAERIIVPVDDGVGL